MFWLLAAAVFVFFVSFCRSFLLACTVAHSLIITGESVEGSPLFRQRVCIGWTEIDNIDVVPGNSGFWSEVEILRIRARDGRNMVVDSDLPGYAEFRNLVFTEVKNREVGQKSFSYPRQRLVGSLWNVLLCVALLLGASALALAAAEPWWMTWLVVGITATAVGLSMRSLVANLFGPHVVTLTDEGIEARPLRGSGVFIPWNELHSINYGRDRFLGLTRRAEVLRLGSRVQGRSISVDESLPGYDVLKRMVLARTGERKT